MPPAVEARPSEIGVLAVRSPVLQSCAHQPMVSLPALTEKIDRGAAGGHEFERLMHQLLLRFADVQGFTYEPVNGQGGDGGIDGMVRAGGVPGLEGPVAFQFKWLYDDVHKANKARQIQDSFARAASHKPVRHWVLVTPWDLKPAEQAWLQSLAVEGGMEIHAWGKERIESLLRLSPALFARYYPHEAGPLLSGYDGFDFTVFACEYRVQVALAHETIRTLGLPTKVKRERDAGMRIPLSEIFVPLRLQPAGNTSDTRTLASVISGGRSAVVLGDPGAGKSTLLAFLVLLHTDRASLEGFTPPQGKVPLCISLRDFARLQQASPGLSFLEYLERHARSDLGLAHAHRAFFDSALRMGEAVVLIDGLDEVGRETARHRIARAVRAFHAAYPSCPFWITSRIYGYTRDVELPSAEFDELHIGRLDDEQVSTFIGRWYAIQMQSNLREREELTESLRHAVLRTGGVRRLAANPLLLTLMAFLHQSLGRLPQERGELYELCIDMLLRTWQEARRGEGQRSDPHPFEKLGLHVATQKDYLAHLAFFVQERNDVVEGEDARGLVGQMEALECLAKRHLAKSRRARPSLELAEAREEMDQFLDYLGDQTGLLVNRGNDKLAFLHLSFQEYLAAWVYLCGSVGPDTGFFIKYLGAPAWEEVILLRLHIVLRAPGGGGEEAFDRIVRALFEHLGRMSFEPGWQTLARAVRDSLTFTPDDQATVLRKAVEFWCRDARFEGEWFGVLEEICLFGGPGKEALRGVIATMVQRDPPGRAAAYTRLHLRLFGTAEERAAVVEAPPSPAKAPPGMEVIGRIIVPMTAGESATFMANLPAAQQRVPELILAARAKGVLDLAAVEKVLDEIEVSLGVVEHSRGPFTILGAVVYAPAIWTAFDAPEWFEAEMRLFADTLLSRADRLGAEDRDALLEATLRILGTNAVRVQVSFVPPAGAERDSFVTGLTATKLWTYLRIWAGMDPHRRGMHARAVRYACRTMHDNGGASDVQWQPMLRGIAGILPKDFSIILAGVEMQSLQILSSMWQNRPLNTASISVRSEQSQRNYTTSFEAMLVAGARFLSGQASDISGNEQWWSFPYSLSPDEVPLTLTVPPEAILLRAGPGTIRRVAPTLALFQGRHDGRAYELLERLAAHPEAEEVKEEYAKMTVLAPWRLVREDPTWIRTLHWSGEDPKGIFESFPASLDDLRLMLSEPPGVLPREEDISSMVMGRLGEEGAWMARTDAFELLRQACVIPGSLALVFPCWQMKQEQDSYAQEVLYALRRFDRPQDMSAAQLATDILFLRSAAAHKPFVRLPEGEIDLRERLPERLLFVLESVQESPKPDTFAAAEAGILRLCARTVENLAGPTPIHERDRLWLTYRLFQWLNLQLEHMSSDARVLGLHALREASPPPRELPPEADLLDPLRFERSRFDQRLGAVVYALSLMEGFKTSFADDSTTTKEPHQISSPELEQCLADIAAKPLTDEERALRHRDAPSCLGWLGPAAIPDLALQALLQLNNEAFFLIAPDARLRWLQELPRTSDDRTRVEWSLAESILMAATDHAKKLSAAERVVVETHLRALEGDSDALSLRWIGFSGLYGAGAAHLGDEVVSLLEQNLAEKNAPFAFGAYLTGLSHLAPEKLVSEAERILAAVETAGGLDPIPFASALANPIVAGAPACVRPVKECLRRLAARPPYRGDDRIVNLLGLLGVS